MKTRSGTKRPVPDWTWDLSYIYQHQLKEAGLVHGPGKGLSGWTFFLKDAPNRKLDDFSGLEHALEQAGWLKEQTEGEREAFRRGPGQVPGEDEGGDGGGGGGAGDGAHCFDLTKQIEYNLF